MRARVDALYLEKDLMYDPEHSALLTWISSKYCLRTVRGKADALNALATPPRVIVVLDSGITKPENEDIADKLARLAWAGSRVILAGYFARAEKNDLKRTLSENLALEWEYRGRGRDRMYLNGEVASGKGLAAASFVETVILGNVLPTSVWYGDSVAGNVDQNAMAILGGYGQGTLGFVGDMNLEDKTKKLIMAMLKARV